MKKIFIPALVMLTITCCNNENKTSSAEAGEKTENLNPGNTDSNPSTDSGNDTGTNDKPSGSDEPEQANFTDNEGNSIFYVGVFARWNYSVGEQYDGSYDSTHSLFVFCSSNRCQKVPRQQINFQEYGNCDTLVGDRIKLFKIKKDGSIKPEGERVKVVGNKGYVKEGTATRAIDLDTTTINRINRAKVSRIKAQQVQYIQKGKKVSASKATLQKE